MTTKRRVLSAALCRELDRVFPVKPRTKITVRRAALESVRASVRTLSLRVRDEQEHGLTWAVNDRLNTIACDLETQVTLLNRMLEE